MVDTLIKEIQDKNIPLSMILLKAKIVATKRKDGNFLKWLELELNGYEKGKNKPPEYRKMPGRAKFWNPMLGWCPILFSNSKIEKQMVNRPTIQSIAEIEQLLEADSQEFEMPYPASVAEEIMRGEMKTKVSMFIGRSSLVGILNKVRNMVLDWALGLGEKAEPGISENSQHSEVHKLKNKAQIIKDFNVCDFQSKTTNEKIYIIKVMYSYYQGILEAYYGSGLFFLTSGIDDLNDYFKILRKKMMEIVDSDETFSEIKTTKAYEGIVESITSLYSATDFFDGVWEDFTLPSIISLREEIADKDLFGNGSEIHTASTAVSVFFQAVDKEIDVMKRYLDQKTKNFNEQELPKYKKQFDDTFNSKKEQTINHKVTHTFENSIQEKDVVLNHKYEDGKPNTNYITQKGDDFYYKGQYLKLSKNAEYYPVFCSLFAKLPDGGEVTYKELAEEIHSRLPRTKGKTDEEMRKFIQGNLTDSSNGFVRYAKIPPTEDNSKPLIEIMRGAGVRFNNRRG